MDLNNYFLFSLWISFDTQHNTIINKFSDEIFITFFRKHIILNLRVQYFFCIVWREISNFKYMKFINNKLASFKLFKYAKISILRFVILKLTIIWINLRAFLSWANFKAFWKSIFWRYRKNFISKTNICAESESTTLQVDSFVRVEIFASNSLKSKLF